MIIVQFTLSTTEDDEIIVQVTRENYGEMIDKYGADTIVQALLDECEDLQGKLNHIFAH